jgi:hypothetical protein
VDKIGWSGAVWSLLGSFLTLVGTLFAKWLDTRNSRSAEQRRAAREVLILVERFAREHREFEAEREEPRDTADRSRTRAALEALTDEIAARSLELDHAVAREHMRAIATALWYCLNKAAKLVAPKPPPYPDVPLMREAARDVLGAVMREGDIPRSFNSETMRLLATARDARVLLEGALKTVRTTS